MPKLSEHHTQKLVKALYVGHSGSGKTGSLLSLVQAGYKLHIIDLDNGLDILFNLIREFAADKIANVDYITLKDDVEIAPSAGSVNMQAISHSATRTKGAPKAYAETLKYLTKWEDGTIPSEWGADHVLVIDSLSALGNAALAWATYLNPTAKDGRTWFFTAQQSVEKVLAMLTSANFNANLLALSHIRPTELPDGSTKYFANVIGAAAGPILPRYFNNFICTDKKGSGPNLKRTIITASTAMIDLKTSAPFAVDQELPLETGLATLFKQLTQGAKQ